MKLSKIQRGMYQAKSMHYWYAVGRLTFGDRGDWNVACYELQRGGTANSHTRVQLGIAANLRGALALCQGWENTTAYLRTVSDRGMIPALRP